jgi:hypothetical protein
MKPFKRAVATTASVLGGGSTLQPDPVVVGFAVYRMPRATMYLEDKIRASLSNGSPLTSKQMRQGRL